MIKITRKSNGGSSSQNHIIFESENPHPKSMAAGVLLRRELQFQDKDFLEDDLWTWLEFREKYLNKIIQKEGDLVCIYCGKPHLEIGGKTPEDLEINNRNKKLATVDHIVALVNGGEKYNEANICVACKKCNGDKGAKPADLYKEKIKTKI